MKKARKPLYKEGDLIKIVNYGCTYWISKKSKFPLPKNRKNIVHESIDFYTIDLHPELVGKIGVVTGVSMTQGIPGYKLHGLNMVAWYQEGQMQSAGIIRRLIYYFFPRAFW